MSIFYFLKMYSIEYIFSTGFLRRDCNENSKIKGGNRQKVFIVILSLYLKYVAYKIIFCHSYII